MGAPALLEDAALGRIKVVTTSGRYYLEWAWGLPNIPDGRGVVRVRISPEAAIYASVLQKRTVLRVKLLDSASITVKKITDTIFPKGNYPFLSISGMCTEMAKTVNAINCLELPGNISAYRGGRLRTAALPWRDWLLLHTGHAYDTAQDPDHSGAFDNSKTAISTAHPIRNKKLEEPDARKAAKTFFKAIRAELGSVRVNGMNRKISSQERRDLQRKIETICQEHRGNVSPSLQMLGEWISSLFDKRNTGILLRISAIGRYFGALSSRFESLFYAVDLRVLDEDELTKVLHELLTVDQTENPEFIHERLREFLKYCERNHGLSTPNWDELQVEDKTIGVSPGYISFATYCKLLVHIRHRSGLDHTDALRGALSAMLSYRFGLRKAESAGLRWKDWIDIEGMIYVVVNRLNHRDLKRNNSRRTVPLLWRLTSFEKKLIQDHAVLMKEHAKTNAEALFFGHPNDPQRSVDADDLASIVTDALKFLGGRHLTHHHLRHTFAANVWRALELPIDSATSLVDRDKRIRVRELLLQSQNVGRRAPWVLARILGHSHPAQGYKSYVHGVCDYADSLTFKESGCAKPVDAWDRLVDLDRFPLVDRRVAPKTTLKHFDPPTMREVVFAIRLIGNDTKPASIARSLQTHVGWIEKALEALTDLDSRLFVETQPKQDNKATVRNSKMSRAASATSISTTTLAKPPKFIFKKAGSSKLLDHILSSKLDAITTMLETASQEWDASAYAPPKSIPTGDFTAAFGPRLQLSFWTRDQMALFKWAIDSFELQRARLTLLSPGKLLASVSSGAHKTGWISDPDVPASSNSEEARSQIFPLTATTGRQEVVHYLVPEAGPVKVEHRYSLLLVTDEKQVIGNKFEFIFCLLACWAWLGSRIQS